MSCSAPSSPVPVPGALLFSSRSRSLPVAALLSSSSDSARTLLRGQVALPQQEQQRYKVTRALEFMKHEKREPSVLLQPSVSEDALAAQLSRRLSMLADATTNGGSQDSSSSNVSVEEMTEQLMVAHTRLQQLQHAQLAHPRSATSNLSPPPVDLQQAMAAATLPPTLVPLGASQTGVSNSSNEESSGGNSVKITVPVPRPNLQQPQSSDPTLQPPRSLAATVASHTVNHMVAHAASAPVVVPTQQLSRVNAAMSSPAAPQAVAGSRDDSSNSRGTSNGCSSCASTDTLGRGSDELMFDLSGSPPERWSSPPRHSPSPPAGQRSEPFNSLHQQRATGVISDADGPDWSWPAGPNDGAQDGLLMSSALSQSPQEPFFLDSPTSSTASGSSSLPTEALQRFRSVSDELAIGEPMETRTHASLSSSLDDVDDADVVTECREHFARQPRSVTQPSSFFDHSLNETLGLLLTHTSPAELRRIHASLKLLIPRVEEQMMMAGNGDGDDDVVILSASVATALAASSAGNAVAPQSQDHLQPPQAPVALPVPPSRAQSAGTKRKSNEVEILMDNWAMQRAASVSTGSPSTSATSGAAAAMSLQPTKRRKTGAYATAQSTSGSRSNVAATGASAAAVATVMAAPVLAEIIVTAAAPSFSSSADRSARNALPKKPAAKTKKVVAPSVSASGDANGAATSKKKKCSSAPKKTQKKSTSLPASKPAQPDAKITTSASDDFLESPSPPTTDVGAVTAPAAAATAAAVQKSPSQAAISTSATTSEQFSLSDGCEAAPALAVSARAAAPPITRFFAQHSASKSKNLLTPGQPRSAVRKKEDAPPPRQGQAARSTSSSSTAPMEDDDDQPLLPTTLTSVLPKPPPKATLPAIAAPSALEPDVKSKESSLLQTVYNKKRNGVPSIIPSTSSQATVGVQMLRAEVEPGKATMVMGALVPVAVPTMASTMPVGQQEFAATPADQQLPLLPSTAPAPGPAVPALATPATPATMVATEPVSLLSEWTTEDVSATADAAPASAPPLGLPTASGTTKELAEPLTAAAAETIANAEAAAALPPPQPLPQLSSRSKTAPKSLTAQEQKDRRKEDVADTLFKAVQERQLSTAASTAEISGILDWEAGWNPPLSTKASKAKRAQADNSKRMQSISSPATQAEPGATTRSAAAPSSDTAAMDEKVTSVAGSGAREDDGLAAADRVGGSSGGGEVAEPQAHPSDEVEIDVHMDAELKELREQLGEDGTPVDKEQLAIEFVKPLLQSLLATVPVKPPASPLSSSPSPIREELRLTAELKADVVHQKDDEASESLATTQHTETVVRDGLEAAGATAMPDVTVTVSPNAATAQATNPKDLALQEQQPSSASQKSATSEEEDEELAASVSDGSEPTAAAAEIEGDSNHGAVPMQVDSVDQ